MIRWEGAVMAETLVAGVFSAGLLACILLEISIVWAVGGGFLLVFAYGVWKTGSLRATARMTAGGVKTVGGMLVTFVLVGAVTAVWRMCGTIPFLVYHVAGLTVPAIFPLISFLACSAVSFIIGTSVGAAGTAGVICLSTASSMGLSPVLTGGAVLSGCFFGDRCSPMSTSAMLVAGLTGTSIFENIRTMVRTSLVPFALSCAVYLALGLFGTPAMAASASRGQLAQAFSLHPVILLPAALVLALSCFRRPVKLTMAVSAVCAAILACAVQGAALPDVLRAAVLGFHPEDAALDALAGGGGVVSMASMLLIILLSAGLSGVLRGTGFLAGFQTRLQQLGRRTNAFFAVLATSLLTGIITCSQALAVMLTYQLCRPLEKDSRRLASHLENTAIVISALIPWSMASTSALTAACAPAASILAACYLYLIPLWNWLVETKRAPRPCGAARLG